MKCLTAHARSYIRRNRGRFVITGAVLLGVLAAGAPPALAAPPLYPSPVVASWASPDSADVAWTDRSTNETVFTVETRAAREYGTWEHVTSLFPGGDGQPGSTGKVYAHRHANLDTSVIHCYRVKASNADGSAVAPSASCTASAVPTTPTGLHDTHVDTERVGLEWDRPFREDGYELEYQRDDDGWIPWDTFYASAGSTTRTTYTVSGLVTPGHGWCFRISAFNDRGTSGLSTQTCVTPVGFPVSVRRSELAMVE